MTLLSPKEDDALVVIITIIARMYLVASIMSLASCGSSAPGNKGPDGGPVGTGGSSSSGAGGTSGGTLTPDTFAMAFEDALCGPEVACGVYQSMAVCETATWFAESSEILTDVAGVHRGAIRFDPTAAAECVGALPSYCFAPNEQPGSIYFALYAFYSIPACFKVFNGLLPAGAPCATYGECAGPTYCGLGCPSLDCCPGTCLPIDGGLAVSFSALGDVCSNFCVPPAVCGLGGICVMPAAEGESCATVVCGRLDDYCVTQNGTSVCKRRLSDGAACVGSRVPCILADFCSGSGVCARAPGLGESCILGCAPGFVCGPDPQDLCSAPLPGNTCQAPASSP